MERVAFVAKDLVYLKMLREKLDNLLYYSEEEDLLLKEDKPKGWNTLEIIDHINLVNGFYLKQLGAKAGGTEAADKEPPRSGFLGKYLTNNFKPNTSGGKGTKFKSPASVHPLKRQEKGLKPIVGVAFRQIVEDLDVIEKHLTALQTKRYERLRIKTLVPWLKVNGYDALAIMLSHTDRHLEQAKSIRN
jgi:hypothetical protein